MAGIVTGTNGNTFYIQTPDHLTDDDQRTTEGVRVYLASHQIAPPVIGTPVVVHATVSMYRNEKYDDLYVCEAVNAQWQECPNLYERQAITPTVIDTPGWPMPDVVYNGKLDESVSLKNGFCPLLDVASNALDYLTAMQHMLVTVRNARILQPTGRHRDTWITWVGPEEVHTRDGLHLTESQRGASVKKLLMEGYLLDREGRKLDTDMFGLGDEIYGDEVTGILDYRYGTFQLLPVHMVMRKKKPMGIQMGEQLLAAYLGQHGQNAHPAAPRPPALNKSSHGFRVATYNLENFNAIDPDSCITARAQAEHIVYELGSADVVAVQEVQDNDGEKISTLVAADISFTLLASWSQQSGGPAYNYAQVDPENGMDGGLPGGNIRQGFLYNPTRVKLLGQTESTKAGPLDACVVTPLSQDDITPDQMLNFNPCRISPGHPAYDNSRKPLLAGFHSSSSGRRYWIINVHLASMAGSAPQYGALQPPPLYREDIREAQLAEILRFVGEIEAADPESSVIILGDFNDFHYSPALQQLWGPAPEDIQQWQHSFQQWQHSSRRKLLESEEAPRGMTSAVWETLPEEERWTYVYEGDAQALDHVLVGGAVHPTICSVNIPHVNTRMPDVLQTSDHDPIVVDLDCKE